MGQRLAQVLHGQADSVSREQMNHRSAQNLQAPSHCDTDDQCIRSLLIQEPDTETWTFRVGWLARNASFLRAAGRQSKRVRAWPGRPERRFADCGGLRRNSRCAKG